MTRAIWSMAAAIRREAIAWAFAGMAAHWIWGHGLDRWGLALTLAALHLHPAPEPEAPSAEN